MKIPHLNVSLIWGGILAVAAAFGVLTDWAIKKGAELDATAVRSDSLRMVDSLTNVRLERVERKLHIQTKKLQAITRPQREGWLRRQLRKVL